MSRVVVAVDPALSTKPTSSETGIVVAGADRQRKEVYVLADESARLTPELAWALARHTPLRQVQCIHDSRRGQRRRTDGQNDTQQRRRTKPAHQDRPRAERKIRPRRTRRISLRTEPAPYPDTGAAYTTSAGSHPSKTRCVPGRPTSAHPTHPTAPTPSFTPSPTSSSNASPSPSGNREH